MTRRFGALGCRACGLVFSTPRPGARRLGDLYGIGGTWADAHPADGTHRVGSELVDALEALTGLKHPPSGARVLDVGCGGGRWLNALSRLGWETYGIEPATTVAFARHHRLSDIPADASFDLVIVQHVLEHLPAPGEALRRCAKALSSRGRLIIAVPSLDNLPRHRDWGYCLNGTVHVAAFTFTCLQALLGPAGLEIVGTVDLVDPMLAQRVRAVARRAVGAIAPPPAPLAPALHAIAAAGLMLPGGWERERRRHGLPERPAPLPLC